MKKFLPGVLLLHLLSTGAFACTCGEVLSPYQAYQEAQAVFIGNVISSEDIPDEETVGNLTYEVYDRHFKIAVTEVFKGKKTQEIDIDVGRINSSCYRGYAVGSTYLVYAYGNSATEKPGGILFAGYCTRSSLLKFMQGDVFYLHNLLQGKPEPVLYDSISRIDDDPNDVDSSRVTALRGIPVIVEGTRGRFSTTTDENGLYSFEKLPDGEYMVSATLPDKYRHRWFTSRTLTVKAKNPGTFMEFAGSWKNNIEVKVVDAAKDNHSVAGRRDRTESINYLDELRFERNFRGAGCSLVRSTILLFLIT